MTAVCTALNELWRNYWRKCWLYASCL